MLKPIVCKVILDETMRSFEGATIHAYLEDVSAADGVAKIVSRVRSDNVSHQSGCKDELEIVIQAIDSDERAQYIVRAHVAPHGSEEIRPGDYLTTQSYPVLTAGHPTEVTLQLREVK